MTSRGDLAGGARNLLLRCAGLAAGDSLLIVRERPGLGWYDLAAPTAVAREARALGIAATVIETGGPEGPPEAHVAAAIAAARNVVFFARIGDQDRFAEPAPGRTLVMCYARDAAMLASRYGTTHHRALVALKEAVDAVLLAANRIEIRCPLGTALAGAGAAAPGETRQDVSVRRFPLGVPAPVPAAGFSGCVALARFLTPTGSRSYAPAVLPLEAPVFAEVRAGRIVGFAGDPSVTAAVERHYDRVAARFGIDAGIVHSWHAGIHPGCAYRGAAADDPDRWSNTVFGNPRFLHFHTCGDYAPGEICWMLLDPTVAVDGAALWDRGRLRPDRFAATRRALDDWPALRSLLRHPADRIGLP